MAMSDSDSDDKPELSEETLKALQSFYLEKTEKHGKLKNLQKSIDTAFEEDWQLSQFWYNEKTTDILAREALRVAGTDGKIALVSCPTVYNGLKKLSPSCQVTLFEFDHRFAAYGKDFIYYDYRNPLDVPRELATAYNIVVADPPFLSEECLTKTAVTVKFLAKDKIVLCTGAVMESLIKRLLNLSKASFEPQHQNNLANEFSCFSNYNIDDYIS